MWRNQFALSGAGATTSTVKDCKTNQLALTDLSERLRETSEMRHLLKRMRKWIKRELERRREGTRK